MQGREYLDLARELIAGGTERHFRATAGRAYYALMLEGRDALLAWGFTMPPRDNVHSFTRLRFSFASDPDLKEIGRVLDWMSRLRNVADYQLTGVPDFHSSYQAQLAVADVANALALLDAINADPNRRSAAIAEIRRRWP